MTSLHPTFILDLHTVCNQKCSYCIAGAQASGDFGVLAHNPHEIEAFFSAHRPFNVLLTGGEPMITPGIESFLRTLVAFGHTVSVQTNLREGSESLLRAVPPERTAWILATLHSVALDRSNAFAAKVRGLCRAGYPVVVKLVLDPPILTHLERLYELLVATGAGILLSPLVVPHAAPGKTTVISYSADDWERIAPKVNLLSAWLFFAGGFLSRGRSCWAGSRVFYGRLKNGVISGCAHSFPAYLGDIAKGHFSAEAHPVVCDIAHCCCDFNTYTGCVEGLDDRHGFELLRQGVNQPVSAEQFTKWILAAGVRLRLALPGVEAPVHESS